MIAGTVLVTGAASGNGRAIAVACARAGASGVVVADLVREPREGGIPTDELVRTETGVPTTFVRCDVTDGEAVVAAVAAAEELGPLGLLVNNAGLFRSDDLFELDADAFRQMLDVNVTGPFLAAQAAGRVMADRGRGAIVNIGSISGLAGAASYAAYCTTKGALRSLTQALAAALGPYGVRVNLVAPGLVRTAMTTVDVPMYDTPARDRIGAVTPLDHAGTPEDIADAVVFLGGDGATWINGASLVVDGGRTSTLPGGLARALT